MIALTNHNEGTTVAFVFALIVPIIFPLFLIITNQHIRESTTLGRFFAEFLVLVCTGILNVTLLSDHIVEVLGIMLITLVALLSGYLLKYFNSPDAASTVLIRSKQAGYVTILRSTIMLLTVICILAVDFQIFPGYSFKTHEYGCSLMDVGIGLFVCSIAVVSNKPSLGHFSKVKNLAGLMWNVSPLIVLGVGRAVIIKQIDYNQDVTEYGSHWNAFLTLGFTRLFSALLASFVPRPIHLIMFASLILLVHQSALHYGVAEFILSEETPRDNFFYANREGILSIPGFVALQLFTIFIGYLLRSNSDFISAQELLKKIRMFLVLSAVLWVILLRTETLMGISRRICNAGYVLWILTLLITMATIFMCIEVFAAFMFQHKSIQLNRSYIPLIMQSINHNGLFFFLLANILTGLINMSIKTEKVSTLAAFVYLVIYMLINCAVVVLLYTNKLKIKFW